ncbi:uncharacterized protein JCM15063_006421 [Sporobolomyces koalae]|uniref:uncharacterized protein n=1 Tax=Sporobolomyces koalae TaxID=500713 RepID=UPI003177AAAE
MPGIHYDDRVRNIAARKSAAGQSVKRARKDLLDLGLAPSRSSFDRWSRNLRLHGDVTDSSSTFKTRGRKGQLKGVHVQYLREILLEKPNITIDSIHSQFLHRFNLHVDPLAIQKYVGRADFTVTKGNSGAIEADPVRKTHYLWELSHYTAEQIICLDENHVNDRTSSSRNARAPRGERAVLKQSLSRGKRCSTIAVLT